ncbi:DUF3105 domain-containing protein [Streptomyces sp. NBC_00286]|uniref:DUF3105 domain-containing protein n=1 Tax=Streptomyces sp. NBC_00286 TaxID=2975701 RepID=UPI002E2BCDE0|nr:DUF3105 domain-containing protein [Streptomyces sp. NBC_00286]
MASANKSTNPKNSKNPKNPKTTDKAAKNTAPKTSAKSPTKSPTKTANKSSGKERTAARRARIEEQRRAERARERRSRIITLVAATAILAGLVGGGAYLINAANDKEQAQAAPVKGEKSWKKLGQDHVDTEVDYPMTPAAGGDHDATWQNCNADVYTQPIRDENAVHALEHGAVWVTYNDKAAEADVKTLTDKVSRTPYSLMSPYENQSSPITLTAWGRQLNIKKASDPRVDEFFDKYVQGPQTPEPGAACTGGISA